MNFPTHSTNFASISKVFPKAYAVQQTNSTAAVDINTNETFIPIEEISTLNISTESELLLEALKRLAQDHSSAPAYASTLNHQISITSLLNSDEEEYDIEESIAWRRYNEYHRANNYENLESEIKQRIVNIFKAQGCWGDEIINNTSVQEFEQLERYRKTLADIENYKFLKNLFQSRVKPSHNTSEVKYEMPTDRH